MVQIKAIEQGDLMAGGYESCVVDLWCDDGKVVHLTFGAAAGEARDVKAFARCSDGGRRL